MRKFRSGISKGLGFCREQRKFVKSSFCFSLGKLGNFRILSLSQDRTLGKKKRKAKNKTKQNNSQIGTSTMAQLASPSLSSPLVHVPATPLSVQFPVGTRESSRAVTPLHDLQGFHNLTYLSLN